MKTSQYIDNEGQRIALFPGSFDPFTRGHESIVRRALPLFDRFIIAIGVNADKRSFMTMEQRKAWIESVFKDDPHVVSGESGAAGFGAFASIMLEEGLAPVREELCLGPDSKVLCFSTEGDTDPVRYKQIVWDGIDF